MQGYREQEKQGRSPEGDNAWIKSGRRSGFRKGRRRSETSMWWEEVSKGACVLSHEGDEDAVCNRYLWWWFTRSVVSDSLPPWTVAPQVPLSMGFPRQEHWSGLPFSSPGDLPNPLDKRMIPNESAVSQRKVTLNTCPGRAGSLVR